MHKNTRKDKFHEREREEPRTAMKGYHMSKMENLPIPISNKENDNNNSIHQIN